MTNTPHNARRPMRLSKREVTDPDQLHGIVDDCQTVRIALVDDEGPFIVPMSFGYDWANPEAEGSLPSLTLWLHSAQEGRKADVFAAEPRVAIEMDVQEGVIEGTYACSSSFSYRSIMGMGTVRKVEDDESKRYGLSRIMEHLAPDIASEFSDKAVARCDIFRIDVDSFTGKQRS